MNEALHDLVVATGNAGKRREIDALLGAADGVRIVSPALDMSAVVEDAPTFVENALKKARHAAQQTGCAALGDDSGLEVDILDGAPGIRSSRYAGETASDQDNIDKLLATLGTMPATQRAAQFRCVMVVLRHPLDPAPLICQGVWRGTILNAPRGAGGFGYDPIFAPQGETIAAAQMGAQQKNAVSHRAQALRALKRSLGEFLRA